MPNHVCTWLLPECPEISRSQPTPDAKYYKYYFNVVCPRCHAKQRITCKTNKLREETMATYEKLPSFPH